MKSKRLIAFLLAIFMLATILPAAPGAVTASAADLDDISITLADAWIDGEGSNGYQLPTTTVTATDSA